MHEQDPVLVPLRLVISHGYLTVTVHLHYWTGEDPDESNMHVLDFLVFVCGNNTLQTPE